MPFLDSSLFQQPQFGGHDTNQVRGLSEMQKTPKHLKQGSRGHLISVKDHTASASALLQHSIKALINQPHAFCRHTPRAFCLSQTLGVGLDAAARYSDNTTMSSPAKYCLLIFLRAGSFPLLLSGICFWFKLPSSK